MASAHSSQIVMPRSWSHLTFVSPRMNHSSSPKTDRVCTFLVVTQREPGGEVEAHLVAEDAAGAGAGAVGLLDSLVEDPPEEVEVRLHGPNVPVEGWLDMVIGLGAALVAAVLFGVGAVVQAVAVRRHGLISPMMAFVVGPLPRGLGAARRRDRPVHRSTSPRSAQPYRWRSPRSWPPGSSASRCRAGTGSRSPRRWAGWCCSRSRLGTSAHHDVDGIRAIVGCTPGSSCCSCSASSRCAATGAARRSAPRRPRRARLRRFADRLAPARSIRRVDLATAATLLAIGLYGLLGFWLYSIAMNRIAVTAATAPVVLLQTLVPAVVGVLVFSDGVRAGWWPVALVGFLVGTAGALVLCGAEDVLEAPRRRWAATRWLDGGMTSADVSARVAWADDAPAIAAVQVRAWRTTYADAAARRGARRRSTPTPSPRPGARRSAAPSDARNRVLVALERNLVTGFVVTGPASDPDCDPVADRRAHRPDRRPAQARAGHGSRLLQAGADTLVADRFTRAVTWLPAADDALRAFLTERRLGTRRRAPRRSTSLGDGTTTVKQVRLHTALVDAEPDGGARPTPGRSSGTASPSASRPAPTAISFGAVSVAQRARRVAVLRALAAGVHRRLPVRPGRRDRRRRGTAARRRSPACCSAPATPSTA